MRIVISSGHGKLIRGAAGSPIPPCLDEVDEARKVVNRVAEYLANAGVKVEVFHDDVSTSQSANLTWLVNAHNGEQRELDISVHFNCYNGQAHGTEVLYVTQDATAAAVAAAISRVSGLTNRGAKYRNDLKFLNSTTAPAILVEVCFCDNPQDCRLYEDNFEEVCEAIAETVSGVEIAPPEEIAVLPPESLFYAKGKASYFGGPTDEGVSRTEGLAFITSVDAAPHLFLPYQPAGTTGLARRLNPYVHYVACRWDYSKTPKRMLLDKVALVRALETGIELKAFPADWGPNENTGRVADLSPCLMDDLGIQTDDEVEVTLPI